MENEKCKHCGALLSEKAKFCFECGTLIDRNKQDEEKPVIASLKDEQESESKSETPAVNELLMNTPSASKIEENSPIINEKSGYIVQKSEEQQYNNQQKQQDNRYNQTNHFTGSKEQFNPYVTPPPSDSKYAFMSIWSYVGMMILFSLPVIGFILAIIWACDSNNINRRNYARAVLVLIAITIIISVIITVVGFLLLYDDIIKLYDSFQKNGYTIPFDKYDIQIDGLINSINIKSGAFTYRDIGDIIAF